MLLSIAFMLLIGLFLGWCCKKIHLPSLVGMILTGILLGPYLLNWIDPSVLNISAELRQIALIIILLRAGLSLDIGSLKKVGRPAILMCFVPACFEIIGMILLAPKLLGLSIVDSALLGAVIGAVSPAVIVPKMIKLKEESYGTKKGIPSMILAGASVDDVFVIVMFTTFLDFSLGNDISYTNFITIPISLLLGIVVGAILGVILSKLLTLYPMNEVVQVVLLLSISFLLVSLENMIKSKIPFSGLIGVMAMGMFIHKKTLHISAKMSVSLNKLWIVAEVILFVLVGASLNIKVAVSSGTNTFILILCVLAFRMIGVFICMFKTNLTKKEKIFCGIGYMPKATVQAAIGGIPLASGLASGNIILTVAVVAILVTAPLGAFLIDLTYDKLLTKDE